MPKVELKPLTPEAQALAARVAEVMRAACAQPGQPVAIPAELARAIDDAAHAAALPELLARRRLEWLHSRDSANVDGYEWGIFRVRWQNGQAVEVWHTNSDFSDLDAARGVSVDAPRDGEAEYQSWTTSLRASLPQPLQACTTCRGTGTVVQDGTDYVCECGGSGVQMDDNPMPLVLHGWKLHRCPDGVDCRESIGGGCASGWCSHFGVQPERVYPHLTNGVTRLDGNTSDAHPPMDSEPTK